MRRIVTTGLVVLMAGLAGVTAATPAAATDDGHHDHGHHDDGHHDDGHHGDRDRLPSTIDLPDGFFPEGIASGHGSTFYVGSLDDGTIFRGDYVTGEGAVLTDPVGPFSTVGLNVDHWGRVWAAGGTSGTGRVYDGHTGELLATYQFTGPLESFVNDVIVTRHAAWFTDSGTRNSPDPANFQFAGEPRLFEVPLGKGGSLPAPDGFEVLPVGMPDIAFPNLNGIETTPDGRALLVNHNVEGTIYRVDRATGDAGQVEIDHTFAGPDGMVRHGRALYVVEPGANRVATVRLDRSGSNGEIVRLVTVPGGETPTTAALFHRGVYVVDARFQSMTGPYQITRLPLACRRVDTTGSGQGVAPRPGDPPDLVRTEATIDSGLLRGTTEAAFTITGPTPTGFAFEGELTFTTRRGDLTLQLAGTLDVTTGEFESSGPVTAGTGRFAGAVGTLALDGVQNLADPAGSFTERVTGEVCFDRGRHHR